MRSVLFILLCVLFNASLQAQVKSPLSHFDHERHSLKVFDPEGVDCQECHNFKLERKTKKIIPLPEMQRSTFKKTVKEICHGCHVQGSLAGTASTIRPCYSCHEGTDAMKTIKPMNHDNVDWARSHSMEARVDGMSCQECHTNSECVDCHFRRNDIEMSNHVRNFRYTHSIEARARPHACSTCHSQHFCIDCHLGERR